MRADIADRLFEAYRDGRTVPLVTEVAELDEDAAYRVAKTIIQRKVADLGEQEAGYKISMTSAGMQRLVGAWEPIYGALTDANIGDSPAQLWLDRMNQPLVEAELVFRLLADVSPDPSHDELVNKTVVHAGIEIPDSRYVDWFPRLELVDMMCDCASARMVVLGSGRCSAAIDAFEAIAMTLTRDGATVGQGTAAAVLGNPLEALRWLAGKLHRLGLPLRRGMLVSSGPFIAPIAAEEATYTVDFTGVGTAQVTFGR
jgi:2-keto-4-pentenoate hydratase